MARALKDHRPGLAKTLHVHGCMRCRHRYEDNCADPMHDALCSLCRSNGQTPDPWWPEARMPDICCLSDARSLDRNFKYDRDLMASLALVGAGPWYRCKTCGRTHPFDPSKTDDYPANRPEDWK